MATQIFKRNYLLRITKLHMWICISTQNMHHNMDMYFNTITFHTASYLFRHSLFQNQQKFLSFTHVKKKRKINNLDNKDTDKKTLQEM